MGVLTNGRKCGWWNCSNSSSILQKLGSCLTCQRRNTTFKERLSESESEVAQSCPTLRNPMDCSPPGSSIRGILQARILEWIAILLQGIFPSLESNPGLPHCRQIFYQLSHQGSPRILNWVADPFSRGSSQPRNRTGFS